LRLYIILLLILTVLASAEVMAQPGEGSKIPNFTLTAVGADGRNRTLRSDSLVGRTVLIVFYAYCCSHCKKELPELAAAWNHCSRGEDVAILVGIGKIACPDRNSTGDYELFRRYAASGWYFVSGNRSLMELFKIEGVPTVIVVDGNGVVRQANVGEAGRGAYCIGINLAHSSSGQNKTEPISCEVKGPAQQPPIELVVVLVVIALVAAAILVRIRGRS